MEQHFLYIKIRLKSEFDHGHSPYLKIKGYHSKKLNTVKILATLWRFEPSAGYKIDHKPGIDYRVSIREQTSVEK